MADSYGVDSLHLNVGDGECTIHLLVKLGPAARKVIVKAVLVDAGAANVSRGDKHALVDALDTIAQRYGSTVLRFDAVVITSWDPDYYGGILDLLRNTVAVETATNPSAVYQIPWLTYDAQGTPLTTFYLPCAPPLSVREFVLDSAGTELVFQYFNGDDKTPVKLERFCHLVYTTEALLGRDLLADSLPPAFLTTAFIASPQALLASNPPASGRPGLYCIAANGRVLGSPSSQKIEKASTALLLLWDNETPQLSHYAAGSVDASIERQLSKSAVIIHTASEALKCWKRYVPGIYSFHVEANTTIHVSWELILMLHAWLGSQDASLATSRPVYSTQYPFYFIKELNEAKALRYKDLTETGQISYDSFLSPGEDDQPFHSKLSDLYKQANGSAELQHLSVWDDYALWVDENHADYTAQDARDWITEQCEYRWAQLSPISARSHEAAGGAPSSKPAPRTFSQFPSSSLAKLRDSKKRSAGRSSVLTSKGAYNLETPAEQPTDDDAPVSGNSKALDQGKKILTKPFPKEITMQVDLARAIRFSQPIQGEGVLDKCIVSSKLIFEGIAGTPFKLGPGATNDFVSSLHSLQLWLKDKPKEGVDIDFDPRDELLHWFVSALGASSMSLSQSNDQRFSSFTLKIGNEQAANAMTFSTKCLDHAFDPVDPATDDRGVKGTPAPAPTPSSLFSKEMAGLLADQNMLVMGLDPYCSAAKAPARTLKVVLADFGLEKMLDSDPAKPLADLQVVLDMENGKRNAVWFDPDGGYRTILRLQYKDDGGSTFETLKGCLSYGPISFHITSVQVVLKKIITSIATSGKTSVVTRPECEISVGGNLDILVPNTKTLSLPMRAALRITDGQLRADVVSDATDVLSDVADRFTTLASGFDLGTKLSSETVKKALTKKLPQLRRISITVDLDENNKFKALSAVSADIEMLLRKGATNDNDGIVVLGTYSWASGQGSKLRGSLWLKPPLNLTADFQSLMPDWEAASQLKSLNEESMGTYLDLKTLVPKLKSAPDGVPTRINEAMIEIGTTGLVFSGVMSSDPPQLDGENPTAYLGRILLRASVSWAKQDLSFNIHLGVDVSLLRCGSDKNEPPSRLIGHVLYKDEAWMLASVIKDFDFSNLYVLLAKKTRVAVSVMLRFVRITYLAVMYKYASKKQGLDMEGVIEIGGLPLTLTFDYGTANVDGGSWRFTVEQGDQMKDKTTKLGSVVDSLMGEEPPELPPFISNMEVGSVGIKGQEVKDTKVKQEGVCIVVSATVKNVDLVFVVYRQANKAGPSNLSINTKYFLKVSLARLPKLNMPLLGEIKQPIDEICFAYIKDLPPKIYKNDVTRQIGLTLTDLTLINVALKPKRLVYQKYKEDNLMTDKDAALAAGSHFTVIGVDLKNQTRVVLDYVFGRPGAAKKEDDKEKDAKKKDDKEKDDTQKDEKKNKPEEIPGTPSKPGEGSKPSEPAKPGGRTKPIKPPADNPAKTPKEDSKEVADNKDGTKQVAPFKSQQGPLTFANIGVHYKVEKDSNTLFIEFDAKCVLGPLGVTLVGFALYIQFGNDTSFNNLKLENVEIGFEGLIIAFDKPPLTLAGAFISTDELTTTLRRGLTTVLTTKAAGKYVKRLVNSIDAPEGARAGDQVLRERALSYSGGVVLRFKVWGFQAAGFYEKRTISYWKVETGQSQSSSQSQSSGQFQALVLAANQDKTDEDSSRFFVFLKAEGPLITLSFATITRITAAFGYNMALRWPRVEEVPTFPFVSMSLPEATPMDQLKSLTTANKDTSWITPKDGHKWLAAGLRVG
ncbi:hypothetical protein SLS60_011017 [Paraconiothyrium brasiliense]|uniref:DUF6603 domain-containing protein n=1 Tax=Paraconiothyrium brasiliense TaxID=300254 RepID=A0ABR3QKB6_9PLEO